MIPNRKKEKNQKIPFDFYSKSNSSSFKLNSESSEVKAILERYEVKECLEY